MKCPLHDMEMVGDNTALRCPGCDGIAKAVYPHGCVCPPGSNLTCQNPICPRGGSGQPFKVT